MIALLTCSADILAGRNLSTREALSDAWTDVTRWSSHVISSTKLSPLTRHLFFASQADFPTKPALHNRTFL
jgi:hypothetical protein